MRRIAIFCFYNRYGHADDYLKPLLDDVMKNVNDLVVVSNGKMSPQARQFFSRYTSSMIERGNEGLDAAAYKLGLLTVGWDRLQEYDEVICFNDTIMGPVYPLSEMFLAMDKRDVDFWGISAFDGKSVEAYDTPTHVQTFWHVYRRRLVASELFRQYWENMPTWNNYTDVVKGHEMHFTPYFASHGFTWSTYLDPHKYSRYTPYPMMDMPTELIRDDRCPVFKRRTFFDSYASYLQRTGGQAALQLFDFLHDETDYDTDLIWDTLLRSYNIADISRTMHLNYELPKTVLVPQGHATGLNDTHCEKNVPSLSSAFIFHVKRPDQFAMAVPYLRSLPSQTDLYIAASKEDIPQVKKLMSDQVFTHPVEYLSSETALDDVSTLLEQARQIVLSDRYDVIGYAHDDVPLRRQNDIHQGTEARDHYLRQLENTLGSQEYVINILGLFASQPRLGGVAPTPSMHGLYFSRTLPTGWRDSFEDTKNFLTDRLAITVPLDSYKPVISAVPLDGWFRSNALKPLFMLELSGEDRRQLLDKGSGSRLGEAIRRSLGYICQSRGYYCASVLTDWYSRIETDSLRQAVDMLLQGLSDTRKGETLYQTFAAMGDFVYESKRRAAEIDSLKQAVTVLKAKIEEQDQAGHRTTDPQPMGQRIRKKLFGHATDKQ